MLPLNEQAYNYLQKLILENHFSYQEVYSETKLSKELGISRTPLRDAVHRLAQEGYIDIIPSKGFMLHQMNRKDVNETFQVRSALETYCPEIIVFPYCSTRNCIRFFVSSVAFGSQSSEEIETLSCFSAFFSRMQSMSASPLSC